tara:strand:- start:320 stop:946 length:627 start_codon:yes stop_codon:yes gene_type:complete
MIQEIWNKLSAIDVNKHKKKRGQFDYLPWNVAISTLMEHYPNVNYDFLHYTDNNGMVKDYIVAPDGSCSVECVVTINEITKKMWLAVTDYNNKAIKNPSSVDIANTKMRCLTKCIATGFGLGWYIYLGDALPPEEFYTDEETTEFAKLIEHECFKGKKKAVKDELRKSTSKSHYQKVLNMMKQRIEEFENEQAEAINQDLDNQMKGKI